MIAKRRTEGAAAVHRASEGAIPVTARKPVLDGRPRKSAQLYPGQIVSAREPTVVTTILGSCVAVCLWDPFKCIGGVNHFMLPDAVGSAGHSPRFGSVACAKLVEQLVALGSDPRVLKAKIFGGACVVASLDAAGTHLGLKNAAMARSFLDRHKIPVVAEETGGTKGRRLVFVTDSGTAWVQEILRVTDGA